MQRFQYNIKMDNKIYNDCSIHRRLCQFFCTHSKCQVKILCDKCIKDHLKVHPRSFIYNVQNIAQVHSFDKVGKMKQSLGKQKLQNQQKIKAMFGPFEGVLAPLILKVKQFEIHSKELIARQFLMFLAKNKSIIENCKIKKTDASKVKLQPEVMIQQTIEEVQVIGQKQNELKQNTQKFTWYVDATAEMAESALKQINIIIGLIIKLLEGYYKIQENGFAEAISNKSDNTYEPFYLKYINVHKIASKVENNKIELTLFQFKKLLAQKDQQITILKSENKQTLIKVQQLNARIMRLKEELYQWESKHEREERQRKQALTVQRQKLQQYLIRQQIVFQGRSITLQRKTLDEKYLAVLLQMIPNPIQLILSQHNLTSTQLDNFTRFTSLVTFRMSFIQFQEQFLKKALKNNQILVTLQLNTTNMDDLMLQRISEYICPKVKHLYLIDNHISDEGIQKMYMNFEKNSVRLESLYISYNKITQSGINFIVRHNYQIKILHISKNPIKTRGVVAIGRGLKNLEELFIGGTEVGREGILAICQNLNKLKKLSLVATQMSTDTVSQILLALHKLQWLDVSYSQMTPGQLKKIDKLREYNKNLQIIFQS